MPSTVEKSLTSNNPNLSPLAGKPAPKEMLIDVARLERDYFERKPDLEDANQLVSLAPADTAVRHSTAPLRKPAYCDHNYRPAARDRRAALHWERHACGFWSSTDVLRLKCLVLTMWRQSFRRATA